MSRSDSTWREECKIQIARAENPEINVIYTSCGSKFVDSDRGRRVEISTQNVYYVGRREWIGIHNNQHKANLKEGLIHSKLQINKSLLVRITSHSYPIDWKHMLADQYCHNVINIATIWGSNDNDKNIFLTGAMNLVPQCSSLREMLVLSRQSKRNLHLDYKEGYLTPQLASIAYQSEGNISQWNKAKGLRLSEV